MGEQKQQVMPGIFMIQEQIMTDPFNPYFEYSVENGRTSGKRFELTIDFTMSTNVAVNGQAGFIVVTVVKPGERKLAAQVRAAHVDQAWGPQCGLKCRELADDDEGNATPEPGAVDLAEEDGEAAEVSFVEDPRTTKKTMIARDITLLEMSWPPKSGPAPRVAYCVRNYRAAHVDVVLDFRGSTNGAVRPLGEGEVGRNENFIQARAVAPVALAVFMWSALESRSPCRRLRRARHLCRPRQTSRPPGGRAHRSQRTTRVDVDHNARPCLCVTCVVCALTRAGVARPARRASRPARATCSSAGSGPRTPRR